MLWKKNTLKERPCSKTPPRKQSAKETISSERLVSARGWVAVCLDTTDFPGSRALWPPMYVGSTHDLTGDLQQNAKNCKKHSQTFSKSQLPNCLHCSLSKLYLLPFGHYILPLPKTEDQTLRLKSACSKFITSMFDPPKTHGFLEPENFPLVPRRNIDPNHPFFGFDKLRR